MYEVAVSVGAELLVAWLVTLALAGISGWLLHGCITDTRPRRRCAGTDKGKGGNGRG